MFLTTIKSIFNIDNVGNRWGVRFLYLITVVLTAAVDFNPFADTDFTPLQNWILSMYNMTEYDPEVYDAIMMTFPLSKGNIIYLLTLVVGDLILLASAYLYAAIYVREFRLEKIRTIKDNEPEAYDYAVSRLPDKPIAVSKLIGRLAILMLVSMIVAVPLVMISVYFMFMAMLGLPFVFTVPVAYLSGDVGLFKSIPYSAKLARKYYFANMRCIAIVFLAAIAVDFVVPLLAQFSLTAFYIIDAAATTWMWLSFAKLAAMAYCTMKDFPIKGSRRPFAI